MGKEPERENKNDRLLVSVLYIDILGFSTLADILDPDQAKDLLPALWESFNQIIKEFGGVIDKQVGDSLLVIWGAPESLEDDAERAISASLEIFSAINDFKEKVSHPAGKALRLRLGIHTGLALAGNIGVKGEYTVAGDTIKIARYLGEQSDPDALIISEATYQAIRGAFKVKRLTPVQLEGTKQLVNIYQIMGELPQPTKLRYRSKGGLETILVGRQDEMDQLESIYKQVSDLNQPKMALITGDIGIGKSRLLFEFAGKIETDNPLITIMSSRSLDQTQQVPYYLWKELWSNRFEVSEDDPFDLASKKIIDGVIALWGRTLSEVTAVEAAHFLGTIMGLKWEDSRYLKPYEDKPTERMERAFFLIKEILHRATFRGPLVILLDDLQWIDPGSLSLLEHLISDPTWNVPLLILACARSEFITDRGTKLSSAEHIDLKPLPISSDIVRQAYPAMKDAPDDLLIKLAERADGNPYFLEEMVKNVLNSEEWELDHYGHIDNLPASLDEILHSRLNSLSLEGRATAFFAAVTGRVFWKGAVLAAFRKTPGVTNVLRVTSHNLVGKVQKALDELMEKELAFVRVGSAFSGEREYIFKHSQLYEVAYHRLPEEYRQGCHKVIADWLAARCGVERSIIVANHYKAAGVIDRAQEFYTLAAEYARSVGLNEEADEIQYHARTLPDSPIA